MINRNGEIGVVLPVSVDQAELPNEFALSLIAFPSPFNASTTLSYSLPRKSTIELGIYDLSGRLVEMLTQGVTDAGEHSVTWEAPGSGVFFAVLKVEEEGKAVRKVVGVK